VRLPDLVVRAGPADAQAPRDRALVAAFLPRHWDGVGDTYSIAQHVDDVIAFIERLDTEPVDLMGHSRGGPYLLSRARSAGRICCAS
jgi:pimeloyl-ACP methyl ester carboxylesterase